MRPAAHRIARALLSASGGSAGSETTRKNETPCLR